MRTRDEVKEQTIREKAIKMIVKEGLDGFSLQKLAKAANVSPATIYIYYHDKEDLIVSLGAEITDNLLDYSLKGFSPDMSFAEGLRVQWMNRARYFIENPVDMQFIEHIRYSSFYDKVHNKVKLNFGAMMREFVYNAIKRKELKRLPFEVYWSVAFAPLYQLIKFHNQGRSYVNREFELTSKMINQTLNLVIRSLKP
jgi:AcrR family transcriptional regulator